VTVSFTTLCAVVEPIFEAGFIDHTFANRVGKGMHRAIEVYEHYRDRHAHALRCDIYRYFPAIDHEILKAEFRRRVSCPSTLALLDLIVDGIVCQMKNNIVWLDESHVTKTSAPFCARSGDQSASPRHQVRQCDRACP
jgi:hypothetical protein